MSHPKSVYELLELLSSRGGRLPDVEVPGHLRNALAICQGEPQLIVPVPVAGAIPDVRPAPIWKLSREGEAELARHRETEAGS